MDNLKRLITKKREKEEHKEKILNKSRGTLHVPRYLGKPFET